MGPSRGRRPDGLTRGICRMGVSSELFDRTNTQSFEFDDPCARLRVGPRVAHLRLAIGLADYISTADKSDTKTKELFVVRAPSAPAACRRSLHGPCRCPSGTGLSSGIKPATPAAASATRAAGNHHAQLVCTACTPLETRVMLLAPGAHMVQWLSPRPHSVHASECGRSASLMQVPPCGAQTASRRVTSEDRR